MASDNKITRRAFIATGGAAGAALVLGFHIHHEYGALEAETSGFRPNGWIRITPDDKGWRFRRWARDREP
jgi:hypothetical protein